MKEETINRINVTRHLIEYELKMVGKTLMDAFNDDKWQFKFTITRNQYIQYYSYAIPLLKKTFRIRKDKAEGIFEWYWKIFGLRIKN
jgi:hypothetical protein